MIGRILFPGAMILSALAYGVTARGFPSMDLQEGFGPGLFPIAVALMVALVAAVEMSRQVFAYRRFKEAPRTGADEESKESMPGVTAREAANSLILVAGVGGAVLLMPYVGFLVASMVLVLGLSLIMGTRPIWKCVLVSVIISVGFYVIFDMGFGVIFAF